MLLQIHDGTLSAGSQTVLSHFDFEIRGKEKIAVIGSNGAGKTTFLRLLAGELSLDCDDKRASCGIVTSRKLTVGFLRQHTIEDSSLTVEEALLKACPCPDLFDRNRFDWEQEYDRIFTGFGLHKNDKKKQLRQFSGGEQTKIALIRLLLMKPDLLLLDEPTNHLDSASVEWLEGYLRSCPSAAVIVSHDRFFLDRTADAVYELSNCTLTRYPGNYSAYRTQKQKNIRLMKKAYDQQQEEKKRLEALIERFKHKPRKAAFARSRRKMLERMPKLPKPDCEEAHHFTDAVIPGTPGPKWVLEAEHLKIGYDHVLAELSLRIRRGQKIGIIGPNGAGKSAFLKTAAGLLPPLKGKCQLGNHVETAYFDQMSAEFVSDRTVAEHFHDHFPALTEKETRTILSSFLFSGKHASKKIRDLSGGERSRLILAELFQSAPNFFLLDEPTNHMDLPARETLESAFRAYTGTLLFVSHDRYFIQQVAESLLIFENDGVSYYPFGYEHYVEHCQRRAAASDPSAQMQAEEQALISSLRNVPKAERHRLRELSPDELFEEWKLGLAEEPLLEIRRKLEQLLAEKDDLKAWEDEEYKRLFINELETLNQSYTDLCLDWYEEWLKFHPQNSDRRSF